MGKVILDVPGTMDIKLRTQDISDAVRKLTQLKRLTRKPKNTLRQLKKFKGIAKYKDIERPEDEWYYQ